MGQLYLWTRKDRTMSGHKEVTGVMEKELRALDEMELADKVEFLNHLRRVLHEHSPFKTEPVDLIQWVSVEGVVANDYNPNSVAPPEMELLRHSINHDGYTQPVVTWVSDKAREVIDGFHRSRVCRECKDVNERVHGYLPVVTVQDSNTDKNDRVASTIRHNRARGKHKVDSMSDIVVELKRRNWTDKKIAKELGMDQDEILRLCQVSGLTDIFKDEDFSKSWDIGIFDDDGVDGELVSDLDQDEDEDSNRIFHTWDKWECHKANFYGTTAPKGMDKGDAEDAYAELLSNPTLFAEVLEKVIVEWVYSCEHYLSNSSMNRIAWLGQAALAYELNIPACFRGGYNRLSPEQQETADAVALKYLNKWLEANDRDALDSDTVKSKTEANLY